MATLKFVTPDDVLVMNRVYDATLFNPLSTNKWDLKDVECLLASEARQKGVTMIRWSADKHANITAIVMWC